MHSGLLTKRHRWKVVWPMAFYWHPREIKIENSIYTFEIMMHICKTYLISNPSVPSYVQVWGTSSRVQTWSWSRTLGLSISFNHFYCFIGFSSFQLLYVIDTTSQTYVEECINWQEKSTLIVSMTISCFPPWQGVHLTSWLHCIGSITVKSSVTVLSKNSISILPFSAPLNF